MFSLFSSVFPAVCVRWTAGAGGLSVGCTLRCWPVTPLVLLCWSFPTQPDTDHICLNQYLNIRFYPELVNLLCVYLRTLQGNVCVSEKVLQRWSCSCFWSVYYRDSLSLFLMESSWVLRESLELHVYPTPSRFMPRHAELCNNWNILCLTNVLKKRLKQNVLGINLDCFMYWEPVYSLCLYNKFIW